MSSAAAAAMGATRPVGDSDDEEEEDFSTADTYANYVPAKVKIGRPHPDSVVESNSLSSVEPPDVTFDLKLPQAIITGGKLSSLQLESVIYASQKHVQLLPDGTRAGFLVGDGAGVGKGRIIAGMIYQNHLEGRKKAVWLSVSNDLKLDASRDLKDLGAKNIEVYSLNKFNYGNISDDRNGKVSEGVIFATYSSLIGESRSGGVKKTRFDQLVKWLGADFDGILVFDECHKAKNLVPASVRKQKGSKTGLTVLRLQSDLPKARVVYCSATGASEPRNMAYMSRLGIWGKGTQFDTFQQFIDAVERRGVGAMELVAIDMKLRGMYIARQLSFAGAAFATIRVELADKFVTVYDAAAKLWVECRRLFQEAADLVDLYERGRWKTMWSQFWSSHQRFFKYMCIAAKVPTAIDEAKKALDAGKCVVVGLQSTGEARTLGQLESGDGDGEINEFFSTVKGVLETLIIRHFPSFGCSESEDDEEEDWSNVSSPDDADGHDQEMEQIKCEELEITAVEDPNSSEAAIVIDSDDEWVPSAKTGKIASSKPPPKKKAAKPPPSRRTGKTGSATGKRGAARGAAVKVKVETEAEEVVEVKTEREAETEAVKIKTEVSEEDCPPRKRALTLRSSRKENTNTAINSKKIKVEEEGPPPVPSPLLPCSGSADSSLDSDDASSFVDSMSTQFVVNVPPRVPAGKKAAEYTIRKMKEELLRRLEILGAYLPKNTLDELVDGLGGTRCVAEMTGRRGRMVKLGGGRVEYQLRSEQDVSTDLLNIREKQRFMDGEKDVAIISEAASCGISLQADRRAKNRKRRVHITLELPWSADRAIQQFGRTHRSNQTSAPEYIFLISALAGEQRFASVVAKRLESLGALTHGDRRASDSRDLSKYNVDTRFGRQALDNTLQSVLGMETTMVKNIKDYPSDFFEQCQSALTGVGLFKPLNGPRRKPKRKRKPRGFRGRHHAFEPVEPPTCLVGLEKDGVTISQFLNRILGLSVELQNRLFSYFSDTLVAIVDRAKREGYWDGGIMDFGCSEENVQIVNTEDFAAANIANTQLYTIRVERGVSFEEAQAKLGANPGPGEGFYTTKKSLNGKKAAVLLRNTDSSSNYFELYRPSIGKLRRMEKLSRLLERYEKEEEEVVRKWWSAQYDSALHACCHAYWNGTCGRTACTVGLRQKTFYMLAGSVLGVWSHIESVFSHLPINHQRVQIIRVKTKTKRLVGVLVPKASVDLMRSTLNRVLHQKW